MPENTQTSQRLLTVAEVPEAPWQPRCAFCKDPCSPNKECNGLLLDVSLLQLYFNLEISKFWNNACALLYIQEVQLNALPHSASLKYPHTRAQSHRWISVVCNRSVLLWHLLFPHTSGKELRGGAGGTFTAKQPRRTTVNSGMRRMTLPQSKYTLMLDFQKNLMDCPLCPKPMDTSAQ